MPTIWIHDGTERGPLAFDLRDLVAVLGQFALDSTWVCSVENCTSVVFTNAADARLHDAYNTGVAIPGTILSELASDTLQVIDGEFTASHPELGERWIRLRAIDSSFWEIEATSDRFLEPFRRRFDDVRTPGLDGGSAPRG